MTTTEAGRWLAALPVYDEVATVDGVLDQVVRYAADVVVVDDGSTDGTSEVLESRRDVRVIRHPVNRGYGAALMSAFQLAVWDGYQGVVTLDCDGQHQPKRIPQFIAAARDADIVSGSRYLKHHEGDSSPPEERLFVNRRITNELNHRLGLRLTDAFCGFKAYRTAALRQLSTTVEGYAMPLQLWVQAAAAGLRVVELPVPLIYLDFERSFGGALDESATRLKYYHRVIDAAIDDVSTGGRTFPRREVSMNR